VATKQDRVKHGARSLARGAVERGGRRAERREMLQSGRGDPIRDDSITSRFDSLEPGFQFCHLVLKTIDHRCHFADEHTFVDVLGTVYVPGFDRKENRAFRDPGIIKTGQRREQTGIIVNNTCSSPYLDPAAVCVVHQEDERLLVFRQCAHCNELLISPEVRKGQRPLVYCPQESCRPTSILDIGLPLGVRRTEIEHIHLCEERFEPWRDLSLKSPCLLHLRVRAAGSVFGLNCLNRRSKLNVARKLVHGSLLQAMVFKRSSPYASILCDTRATSDIASHL
jgi:hypothetical protein